MHPKFAAIYSAPIKDLMVEANPAETAFPQISLNALKVYERQWAKFYNCLRNRERDKCKLKHVADVGG